MKIHGIATGLIKYNIEYILIICLFCVRNVFFLQTLSNIFKIEF